MWTTSRKGFGETYFHGQQVPNADPLDIGVRAIRPIERVWIKGVLNERPEGLIDALKIQQPFLEYLHYRNTADGL